MIKGFADAQSEGLFGGQRPRRLPNQIHWAALRKLLVLDAADVLKDLRLPPGNRLEKLKGRRTGEFSIRIDDQRRICFEWHDGDVYSVELADYHS
jgi:proteic killer suppression protein